MGLHGMGQVGSATLWGAPSDGAPRMRGGPGLWGHPSCVQGAELWGDLRCVETLAVGDPSYWGT